MLQRTLHRLQQEDYACIYLDVTQLVSESTTELQWYKGELIQSFEGGSIGLTRVAFSPDGKQIPAGSLNNTIKIWALDSTLLTTLSGHISSVESVAFSPDGRTLASGGDDQTAILWNLEQILDLNLLEYGCDLVRDYLKTNT